MWPFHRKGRESVRLDSVTVNIPGAGSATWVPDESETKAAWSLYVEMSTRIGVQPFEPGVSSVREGLTSIYVMFGETRRILSMYGPGIARGKDSFAPLALRFLNNRLRPFLTKWNSELKTFERAVESGGGANQVGNPLIEAQWPEINEFIDDLDVLKGDLEIYCEQLLTISGGRVEDGNDQ
jgi:hypothetical protein